MHAAKNDAKAVLNARKAFLISELAKEKDSLTFIATLTSERAKRGADIVILVIKQLQVELEWLEAMLNRRR